MDVRKDDSTFRHTLAGCEPTLTIFERFLGQHPSNYYSTRGAQQTQKTKQKHNDKNNVS